MDPEFILEMAKKKVRQCVAVHEQQGTRGGLYHFPPKFAHIFVPVITFSPFLL